MYIDYKGRLGEILNGRRNYIDVSIILTYILEDILISTSCIYISNTYADLYKIPVNGHLNFTYL